MVVNRHYCLMAQLEMEISRVKAAGATKIGSSFKKSAQVRNIESTLRKDDVFIIPENPEVWELPIRGSSNKAEFMFVITEEGDAKRLFPSMLQKSVRRYEVTEPGDPLIPTNDFVRTKGTVAKEVQKYGDINDFFKDNKGKKVKITDVEYVPTQSFNDKTLLTDSPVMTFDFV